MSKNINETKVNNSQLFTYSSELNSGSNKLILKSCDPQIYFISMSENKYEKINSCKPLEGIANFALSLNKGEFAGWTAARTSVSFKVKNIQTGEIYNCNGSLSANIAKSGSEYIITGTDGKKHKAQNYLLSINISINGGGMVLNDSITEIATVW